MDYQNNPYHPNQMPQTQQQKKKLHPGILAAIIALCVVLLWAICFFAIHIYSEGTCSAPEKCYICGKTRGSTKAHQWTGQSCDSPAVCRICGAGNGTAAGHSWVAANCTTAQYCQVCGTTVGSPADHSWTSATCSAPQQCQFCGLQSGSPAEHAWIAATCTSPTQCQRCGATSGSPSGHNWSAATYSAPQTCTLCGATSGSPLSKPDINVENQVTSIRSTVNAIAANADDGYYRKVTLREGVVAYYDGSSLKKVVVYRGTDGIGQYSDTYSRTYYFSNGTVIFAFFEGKDSHRLYFYDGALMRWRYTPQGTKTATNHDYDFSDEYFMWEELALDEVRTFF